MRIKIILDVTKPLLRKKKLNIGHPESVWVTFKYENMPNFYFCCVVISHGHKECNRWMEAPELYGQIGLPYGNFLRADFNGGSNGVANQSCAA